MVDVEVTFEYAAEQEDELNIKVGDIIKNVTMSEGGWWEGELSGKVGMFPDNFVKVIEKPKPTKIKENPPLAARIDKQRGASVRELASKIKDDVHVGIGAPKKKETQPNVKRKKAKVVFSYEPENEDELKLDVGDIVEVLKQEEEGWWEGTLNGKVGMFPSNFAEEIEETESEKPPEEKPKETPVEGKKKLIGGVGLGNIFEGGPIKLKSTSMKSNDKVSHSPPDPVVRPTEEETKPHPVAKREKHGVHVQPPIPAPRPSHARSPTPQPSTSRTSDSYPGDSWGSLTLVTSSKDNSHTDLEERAGVDTQDSWVNILFGEQGSDDETTNGDVQFKQLMDDDIESDVDEETSLVVSDDDAIPGEIISKQSPAYTIRRGLNKLSLMQLTQPKDLMEENLIEYADVEVDDEDKENVVLGRCVSAIASLGNGGSRTSFLGRNNASNNNSVDGRPHTQDDLKAHSKSVDSFQLNTHVGKQNSDISLRKSRIGSWLSEEHRSPTVSATSDKRKESLFKRVIKLDIFRKRSKTVMPYNGKETEGRQTENCNRQVPSLTELCRIKLTPDCTDLARTPLKEITASHVNEKQDPDQWGSFEVSVDSLDCVVRAVESAQETKINAIPQMFSEDKETAQETKTNAIPHMFSEDEESLLTIMMSRDDVCNDDSCDKEGAGAQGSDIQHVMTALEEDLCDSTREELRDRIARDSYLGSLNRTGQLSPFIRMIASRYHLFDPSTQKWKDGYMDGPEHLDLSDSSSPDNLHPDSLPPNSPADQQMSACPVGEMALRTPHVEASPVLTSYNVLPPGSVKEKVFLYEHLYVNDLVDQVIARTMHGLCVEQCLEELGTSAHHSELRRQLMKEYSQYTGTNSQRSEGEVSPPGSELSPKGSDGEVITPKGSDGEMSSESEDGCVQSSGMCQSLIEDSLYSAMTDYATAMSDTDTDGSYMVSFLSNADFDISIPEPEVRGQPVVGFNASGEYVDLPEQLSRYNGCYGHSQTAVKPFGNPVLLRQTNMDGPWVSPVQTRLRMGTGTCPRKDTLSEDGLNCSLTTQCCSIGTQTPDIASRPTSADDTPTNRSTIGMGGNTEDRASSPIKELLSYDTTLEDSLNTSDLLGSPSKVRVRPRYSSSPIKTHAVDQGGKRKLEDASYKHGKVHCSDSWLTRNRSLPQQDKSNHSLASRTSSLDVNTDDTFDVRDCTEKRRKRFSWKKMFRSKSKEPVVLISYRRRSDRELEEDLIKGSPIPGEAGRDVTRESERTTPLNCNNHALCENQVQQDHPVIVCRTRPFSEDLNTVETFFCPEQDIHHSLDQYINQRPDRLSYDRIQLPRAAHKECEEESDGEQYSLCDMEIDEEEEQARIDRVRDTRGQCGQCDLSDLHIHGQSMSHSAVHSDIMHPSKEAGRTGPSGVDHKSWPDEDSYEDSSDTEGVSLDSPNMSPSLAIAIRNNMVATPDSPEINLDSFLQEALRPIDDLLDESAEGIDLEEEITPRFDSRILHRCTSESPQKYPGFTYISPSMENILAMYEDETPSGSQYVHKGHGDVPSARDDCHTKTDTSNLSLEYVLSLERKFKEELGSPELENTPQNTPLGTPQHTPLNTPRDDLVERYPSFTFVAEEVSPYCCEEKSPYCCEEKSPYCCEEKPPYCCEEKPPYCCEEKREVGMSNMSSSAEGLYDYEDSFESSDSEEEREGQANTEKNTVNASIGESEEIEEVIEVDSPLDQSANDSSGLDIPSFQDGTQSEGSYLMYRSDRERVPSFMTEYMHSTPSHHHTDMFGACALPTLDEERRGDNQHSVGPDFRGRSSYSFAEPSTEVIEEGGLSDSGLLLSFSSSPDNSSNTINV